MSDEYEFELDPETESISQDSYGGESRNVVDEIDLYALAEELYSMLRKELKLERERQGWNGIW